MDCEQSVTIVTPRAPVVFDPVQWTAAWRRLMGQLTLERTARSKERQCIRDLKSSGAIR